jgi:hypothetical protein
VYDLRHTEGFDTLLKEPKALLGDFAYSNYCRQATSSARLRRLRCPVLCGGCDDAPFQGKRQASYIATWLLDVLPAGAPSEGSTE